MAIGGAIGVGTTTAVSLASGVNPFTGNFILKGLGSKPESYNFALDPLGDNITLYRGVTGTERKGQPLFMTDDPEYAATYVRNGGKVVKITMSKSTYSKMYHCKDISPLYGEYFNSRGTEYRIEPRMAPEFIKRFVPYE